ncbi:double C2-like domain-containing protein alpha [Labrus mixtus]|uniref:double C2-like domain-containing protein alpha n=1 Tax=Labrus mixtus TaxID=508554 RepID=UPI0029C01312|nr:double C2-like domain-containing protein alpha [Labrus mixtus]
MASSLPLLLLLLCTLNVAHSNIRIFNLRATGLPSDLFGTTDGYVKVSFASVGLGKTSVQRNTVNPWWTEEFSYFNAEENDVLMFEVFDSDLIFDDLLGVCQRQVKVGTHSFDCYLEKQGTFHYSYTLQGQRHE